MSIVGNITTTTDYRDLIASAPLNNWMVNRIPLGIYQGGDLSIVSNTSVSINNFDIQIGDASGNIIKATSSGSNTITCSTVNIYIIARWSYTGTSADAPTLTAVSSPLSTDIIFGVCVYSGSTLQGFNLSLRSDANAFNKFISVEPTNPTSLAVKIRAGSVSNFSQTYFISEQITSNMTAPVTSGQSVINIIAITPTGAVTIITGTAATTGSQIAPSYNGNLALAQVTIANGQTAITSSSIVDVRPFMNNAASSTPSGSIIAYGGTSAPSGFLLCDGSSYLQSTYPTLYSVIGTGYGQSGGNGFFNVPDIRGLFIRGVDTGVNRDPDTSSRTALISGGNTGDNVGSYETDQFDSHTHTSMADFPNIGFGGGGSFTVLSGGNSDVHVNEQTGPAGGSETRPKNVYCWYIIKI